MATSLQIRGTGSRPAMPMPTTAREIHDAAAVVRGLRRQGLTWKEVSARSGYSRVQALQLVHNVFALTDATNHSAQRIA